MKRTFILLGSLALAVAAYLILHAPESSLATSEPDELDDLGNRVGRWGAGQRLSGAGSSLAGNVEQVAGDLVGNDQLSNQGSFDQAKGAVKDAAGQVANAVEETIDDLNR